MKYYTLVGKPIDKEDGEDFEIIFGDFDRETVEYEKESYSGVCPEWRGMKIIITDEDQASITSAVKLLNGETI